MQPGPVFRHQRVADLVYRLYRGTVDLSSLTVLERRDVTLAPGLEASLVVLGASHALELRWGHARAAEILACSSGPPSATVLAELAPGFERRFELPGLALDVRVAVVPDDRDQRERLRRLLGSETFASRGLAVPFPAGGGADGALTLLLADPSAPRVETIHSYPAEEKLVLTETRCVL